MYDISSMTKRRTWLCMKRLQLVDCGIACCSVKGSHGHVINIITLLVFSPEHGCLVYAPVRLGGSKMLSDFILKFFAYP